MYICVSSFTRIHTKHSALGKPLSILDVLPNVKKMWEFIEIKKKKKSTWELPKFEANHVCEKII